MFAAEQRIVELESLLLRLEDEKATHVSRVTSLQERINDLDIEVKGQESKLQHRNQQVTELQQELNEKISQVTSLEREVSVRQLYRRVLYIHHHNKLM